MQCTHVYVLSDAVPFCKGRYCTGGSGLVDITFVSQGRLRNSGRNQRGTARLTWPHASNARVHHFEQAARVVLHLWHVVTEIAPPADSRARVRQRPNVAVAEQVRARAGFEHVGREGVPSRLRKGFGFAESPLLVIVPEDERLDRVGKRSRPVDAPNRSLEVELAERSLCAWTRKTSVAAERPPTRVAQRRHRTPASNSLLPM